MIIVCPVCYHHLSEHNLLEDVTLNIRETQDPITVIYNFHNKVNVSSFSHEFPYNEFCEMYKCERTFEKKIDFIYSINV